jgi:hypothetical protein
MAMARNLGRNVLLTLGCALTASAFAAPSSDSQTRLENVKIQSAKLGATSVGQTVYQVSVFCQQPPAIPVPAGVLEAYEARGRKAFAIDPDYDADYAKGMNDTGVLKNYQLTLSINPELAQQGRADVCHDLIDKLPTRLGQYK